MRVSFYFEDLTGVSHGGGWGRQQPLIPTPGAKESMRPHPPAEQRRRQQFHGLLAADHKGFERLGTSPAAGRANRFRSLYFDGAFWHLADDEVIDFLFFVTRFRCGAVDHASNNGMDPPFDEHQVLNVIGDRP